MTQDDPKGTLHEYLVEARTTLLRKLDGLDEYDVRRPLTPTGTNLLGLVKHVAVCAAGYFGETFDRPFPEPLPWSSESGDPHVDMWSPADESRADVLALWSAAWRHADETIDAVGLDAVGRVPWWPGDRGVLTLHRVLVHMVVEVSRHAGHADILRETIDGQAGRRSPGDNLPEGTDWAAHRQRVEDAARIVGGRWTSSPDTFCRPDGADA